MTAIILGWQNDSSDENDATFKRVIFKGEGGVLLFIKLKHFKVILLNDDIDIILEWWNDTSDENGVTFKRKDYFIHENKIF